MVYTPGKTNREDLARDREVALTEYFEEQTEKQPTDSRPVAPPRDAVESVVECVADAVVESAEESIHEAAGNLSDLCASGILDIWVKEHAGEWNHDDWQQLLRVIGEDGSYAPLDVDQLGRTLHEICEEWRAQNLDALTRSAALKGWVKERAGQWTHADWLELLGSIRQRGLWPVDAFQLGETLEELKGRYRALLVNPAESTEAEP
jgi:hypothetical protein